MVSNFQNLKGIFNFFLLYCLQDHLFEKAKTQQEQQYVIRISQGF